MIRPVEIQNKQFLKSVRGYNAQEVDEYMAQIVQSMEELIQTNIDVTAKVKSLEKDMARFVQMEQTINEAMILAQKTSEDMIRNSEEKAKYIVERAEGDAQKILNEANAEVLDAMKRKEEVIRSYQAFIMKFKVILESELKQIDTYDLKAE
jgi:cell division initiation protein